jgi:hypothetical protein
VRGNGQILIVIAILLMVGLTLLAVAIDAGRLMIERTRLERGAQSAANAGLGWVAEQIVTLAVPRMTAAAGQPACTPDAGYGTPAAACTATPEPAAIARWLTDEDRARLVSPPMQTAAASEAIVYARRNGLGLEPSPAAVWVEYPHDDRPLSSELRLLVSVQHRATILLAGLLGHEFVDLSAESQSELPLR